MEKLAEGVFARLLISLNDFKRSGKPWPVGTGAGDYITFNFYPEAAERKCLRPFLLSGVKDNELIGPRWSISTIAFGSEQYHDR